MKAYTYNAYGSPEVLKLEEVEIPIPKANEVVIQTNALSINPSEWHKLTASFWMLRLSTGLFKPKKPILGADVAGTVVATGTNVQKFKPGDQVFGRSLFGCLSEYCCIDESAVAMIPKDLFFEEAAALPLAAVTALIALRDKGEIKANQDVLINGASGGIGTFAVQLAKHFGASVTGVTSTENIDLVTSLGTDKVIDYKKEDLAAIPETYDLIVDLVGNRKIVTLKKLLKPKGKCILVGVEKPQRLFSNMFTGMIISAFSNKKIIPMDAQVGSDDLALVAELTSKGNIRPFISKLYDFDNIKKAFTQLGTRRTKGKIVVKI